MSDEEKSIEEIIAELESLEKQAKEEGKKQVEKKDDEMPEELTLEEPHEDVSSEKALATPDEAQAEQGEYEDIFVETPHEKPRIEIEIEELSDDMSLKDAIEEEPSDALPPDENAVSELSLKEPIEELTLDEPIEMKAGEDEDVIEFSRDSLGEEKQKEAHGIEEDMSLKELSPEEPREEPTVDISSEIIRDDESFEILRMEQGADVVTSKEPSFDDVFDETGGDRPSESFQDKAPPFGDQTMKLTVEDIHQERHDDMPDDLVLQDLSDEKIDEEAPSAVPFALSSGGEPPEKTFDDEAGDVPPDEPPTPPQKTKTPLRLSRVAILLSLFLVSVVLYGIFVWPKLYEYRSVKSGDVKYQVKINRITKTQQYFDAGSWHRGAIPKKTPQIARHKIEPKPAAGAEEAQAVVKEPITPQIKQEVPAVQTTPPEKIVPQGKTSETGSSEVQVVTAGEKPVETPATPSEAASQVSEKATVLSGSGEVKEPEQKAEQIVTAVPVTKEPPQTQEYPTPVKTKQYVIQLSSMRLEEFADDLVKGLKKKGWSAYKDIVRGKDNEPWYRVFIGGFAARGDAVSFIKENNLDKAYPGSYIRSTYSSATAAEK